ncbi:thiol reductant ABC exporter subunit CydC [Dyella sp. A6]|uniref:thiol reductant ABC exporter subunit CydC n=1 Tax=Dyella aluminiiresistens TaxID=3069105 RepID=UPI002E7943DF|nr:thiol reductant ABC exporter subunit CydC [Dyella sp. A6]
MSDDRSDLLHRLLALPLRRDRAWMLAGTVVALLSTLSGIGLLAVSGHFITSMAIAGATGAAINYYTPAALIRLFAILRTGGRYIERLVTHEATLRVLARLRLWLFDRLVPLAPARLGGLRSAELFSRLRADVDALEHAYLGVAVPLLVAAGVTLVVLAVAAGFLPLFALALAVLCVIAGVLLPRWALRHGRADGEAAVRHAETLRMLAADGLQGRAELALYGAEAAHAERVAQVTVQLQQARARTDRLQATGSAGVTLAGQLAVVAALLLGIPAVGAAALAAPELTMLVLLSLGAFEAIAPLPEAWAQLGAMLASARPVFALADTLPAVTEPATASPAVRDSGIAMRQLRLRHGTDTRWALDGVDLDLPPGRRLALVGPSGAGKSSLVGALLRFLPYEGTITLGGVSLDAWHGNDVRARIAVVDQQPYLFGASLRDNLRVARPDASDEAILAALEQAQLGDYVASLPHGLTTWVGENGVRVSGGEARRIAIARALLADAPVLVLDEPLEGLDAGTAADLYRALSVATRGRSVLLITHRLGGLSTLVDEVASIREGRVVGCVSTGDYLGQRSSGHSCVA